MNATITRRGRDGSPASADPMTRVRAREAAGLHKLRKGRDQCTAHRRDGGQCLAPAVEGALVCRHHGGASPQVQIAARHFQLMQARYTAVRNFQAARGTSGEFDALCRALAAERDLSEYRAKLAYLAALKADIKALKAAGT